MANNFFDHLKNIFTNKSDWNPEYEKSWNTYMINRYISHKPELLDAVLKIQQYPNMPTKSIYNFYKNLIPKQSFWIKYIKSSKIQYNDELVEKLANYFQLGKRETTEYLYILSKDEMSSILEYMGEDEKVIKKLLK